MFSLYEKPNKYLLVSVSYYIRFRYVIRFYERWIILGFSSPHINLHIGVHILQSHENCNSQLIIGQMYFSINLHI